MDDVCAGWGNTAASFMCFHVTLRLFLRRWSVALLTLAVWATGLADVSRIGDIAVMDVSLPSFLMPDLPFNWETLMIICHILYLWLSLDLRKRC